MAQPVQQVLQQAQPHVSQLLQLREPCVHPHLFSLSALLHEHALRDLWLLLLRGGVHGFPRGPSLLLLASQHLRLRGLSPAAKPSYGVPFPRRKYLPDASMDRPQQDLHQVWAVSHHPAWAPLRACA